MFLTFFISGLVVLVTVSSNQVLGFFESRPQVTAFLKDGTTSDKIKEIQERSKTDRSFTPKNIKNIDRRYGYNFGTELPEKY